MATTRPPPSTADGNAANAKRQQRLTSSRKVCVVCENFDPATNDYYVVYFVDPDSEANVDEFISMVPTLRMGENSFGNMAFCVLHSTLYMFETSDVNENPAKSVYSYDLSDIEAVSNLQLKKADLYRGQDMSATKVSPQATVIYDDSILLFSSTIVFGDDASFDFELYNTSSESWKPLPGICYTREIGSYIISYSVRDSKIFVSTDAGIMFYLDLTSVNMSWQQFAAGAVMSRYLPCGEVFWAGKDICFATLCAYEIQESCGDCRRFFFPETQYRDEKNQVSEEMTLLDKEEDDSGIKFCAVRTAIGIDSVPV